MNKHIKTCHICSNHGHSVMVLTDSHEMLFKLKDKSRKGAIVVEIFSRERPDS